MRLINENKTKVTLITFILILLAFIANPPIKSILFIIATVLAGLPIAIKAYQAIRFRVFSIELLVTIAVIGALIIGEYLESAVVTFLFLFGDYLESRTLEKTRSALKELTELAPDEALILKDDQEVKVPVDEVEVGDIVILYSGEKVPVDGQVIYGKAHLNEAVITGESMPKSKTIEEKVYSGTIVDSGYLRMKAEKVGDDTTFAQIIELVEEAQESKTKTEKFLDKFAAIYTPAIVVLAIIVYIIMRDLHVAITFLVIACPGALVIGAPVSTVAGIGNAARNGVLIKGGEVLDNFSKVDTVVFDKTGTLTQGNPSVTAIRTFNGADETEVFEKVAEIEQASEHHLGKTIVKAAEARGMTLARDMSHVEVMKGHGLKRDDYFIGNRKMMAHAGAELTDEMATYASEQEKTGHTAVFVADREQVVMVISIKDELRPDAQASIQALRANGVKDIIMLTGDNAHTAKLVADSLGLDHYEAELLPEDKVAKIRELVDQGRHVAMAGDGINDAPAIATADIGVAMGEGGTDVSMETADVVLMADKLSQFVHAQSISKKTIANMKQNTFIALSTVILLLIGVLNQKVHLASGMFIHEASVLVVILNGMRLLPFKRQDKNDKAKREIITSKI